MTTVGRKSHMRWIVLGIMATLCLGLAGTPAWSLGPGAPPVITFAGAWVNTDTLVFGGSPQLSADVQLEIPGGNVPLNVASVTVTVPGIVTPFTMPLQRQDLGPEREYFVNLTQAGVVGFPSGTYTFAVTDTSGGVTTTTDTLTVTPGGAPGIAPTASISIPGTTQVSNQPGFLPNLTYASTFILDLSSHPAPTVNWSAVAGAATYRLRIQVGGLDQQDQDVFTRFTTSTSLTLPPGVMVPGRRYRVRVESYDDANGNPAANSRGRNAIEVVTLGPEIFLTFQKSGGSTTYAAGDTLDVTARIYNTGPSVTVNAQAWIGVPTLGVIPILNMPGLTTSNSTANPTGPNDFYSGSIGFSYMFGGGEPSGFYVVGLRLTDPSTGETVAQTSRTFRK